MKKKGISLIVLTITMIVMSILAFTIVISLDNSTDEAKATGFAMELREIIDASQAYYLQYGELPAFDGPRYTKTDLLGISSDAHELQNEFNINKDNSTNYYKIDLEKIALSNGLYGSEKKENDFYVISEDCNFVYYPLGVKINDNIYYSFTNKLVQINHIDTNTVTTNDVISTTFIDKISVSKSTDNWTNSLVLTIDTSLDTGEKLYYIVGGVKTQINEGLPYTLELSNASVSSNSALATEIANNEYVVFQKENSAGKVIAKCMVEMQNLDINSPVINEITVKKYSDYTLVEFTKATDDKSAIKASYYTTDLTDYTGAQLLSNGNIGGAYYIKLDAGASYVQFILADNAGNISEVQEVSIE